MRPCLLTTHQGTCSKAAASGTSLRHASKMYRKSGLRTHHLPPTPCCPHTPRTTRPAPLRSSSQDPAPEPNQPSSPQPFDFQPPLQQQSTEASSLNADSALDAQSAADWVQEEEEEEELDLESARQQQEEYLERLGAFYDQRAPFRFDSPEDAPNVKEQLLEHASVEVTSTAEYRLFTVGADGEDEEDEREVIFNVTPVRWLFSITTPLPAYGDVTYNQRQLQLQGHDPEQYQLGSRLAMWVGCREFLSTNEMVHLRDQFPFLTWVPQEGRWKEELDPSVRAKGLLDDVFNLNQNVKFTPFYPLYFLGATEGSDMLPCMLQLPPNSPLTSANVFCMLGISPAAARLFPRPLAFKSGADFIKYMKPRVEKGAAQFQEFLDESVENGHIDGEDLEELNELEHFDEWLESLRFLASYAKPPFLLVVAGNANLGFDRVPVFFLGTSPKDPSRVVGAIMGLSWDDNVDIQLK